VDAIDIAVRNGGGLKTAATKPGLEFLGGLLPEKMPGG
jgi:hypothetical protein